MGGLAWALGEISLPLCPRLFMGKTMFSMCFGFLQKPSGECEVPTLLGLGRGYRSWCGMGREPQVLGCVGWSPGISRSARAPVLGKGHMCPCFYAKSTPSHPVLTLGQARATVPERHEHGCTLAPHLGKQRQDVLPRVSGRSFASFLCWGSDK